MRSMLHISGGKRLPERDYGHIEKVNPAGAGLTLVRCVALRCAGLLLASVLSRLPLAPTAHSSPLGVSLGFRSGFPLWQSRDISKPAIALIIWPRLSVNK